MKFNEKLIELRKKAGLSQEELGYKLNVTRQTVSKWELGTTTPEMDKLVEIGKIFNVSVDYLITDNQEPVNNVIEDQPIGDSSRKNNNKILITILVIVLIGIALYYLAGFIIGGIFINKIGNGFQSIFGEIVGDGTGTQGEVLNQVFDQASDIMHQMSDMSASMLNNISVDDEMSDQMMSDFEKNSFKSTLEVFSGDSSASNVKTILEEVIKYNQMQDQKIVINYNDKEIQDIEELRNLSLNIDNSKDFNVSLEYDKNGDITKVLIKSVISDFEKSSFNSSFEIRSGTKMGGIARIVLDEAITSNKTEERKITVVFDGTETQDENEIRNMKKKIQEFENYEIYFDYDTDGFINKVTVEKF